MLEKYDNISDINVKAGGNFDVSLETISGTGYTWTLPMMPNCVNLLNIKYETGNPKLMGGPVKQIFTFEAVTPCQSYLEFCLERPWEKQCIKQEVYALIVKAD